MSEPAAPVPVSDPGATAERIATSGRTAGGTAFTVHEPVPGPVGDDSNPGGPDAEGSPAATVAGVVSAGDSASGRVARAEPVTVLIHGLGLGQEMWASSLPFFADRRVVTYDLLGHGASDAVTSADCPVTLTDLAAQVVEVLDVVGAATAHLVGFSIGGMINRRVVLDSPERVASIAVLNSPHDRGSEAQAAVEARAAAVRDGDPLSTLDAAIQRWFTPDFIEGRPDVIEQVTAWRHGVDHGSYADAAWVLANGVVELTDPSLTFDVPSMVMTSGNDTGSTPAMAGAIAAQLGDCPLGVVPDRQHLGILEDPAAFCVPVVAFLDDIDHTAPFDRNESS